MTSKNTDIRVRFAVALAGLALGLGGCATNDTLEELRATNRNLEQSQQEVVAENDDLRARLAERETRARGVEGTVDGLRDENDRLLARLSESDAQLQRLDRMIGEMRLVTLDVQTDEAMADLAARNDAIEYDAALGLLRFSSDLTFASGSADVQPAAREALRDLADTLSGLDEPFELKIVGHTDSVRPSARTAQRFPTNRHLSVARAISVAMALSDAGIAADSMLVGGWGPYRPLVPHSETGGTPANRRVEIALMAPTNRSSAADGGQDGATASFNESSGSSSSIPPVTK